MRYLLDIIFGRNNRDMKAHKIVIFGDGFALGYGDWVTMGSRSGVSGYLADLIKSEARIRKRWKVYNAGSYGSTSTDWLPPTGSEHLTKKKKGSRDLFRDVFSKGASHADADVFVLVVGFNDFRDGTTPEKTVENVKIISETLRSRGKIVYVVSIPSVRTRKSLVNRPRNLLLGKFLEVAAERNASGGDGKIFQGPKLGLFRIPSLFGFDELHFSSKGYKLFATRLFQDMLAGLTSVEFKSWRPHLFGGASALPIATTSSKKRT
eukprot:g3473.t1